MDGAMYLDILQNRGGLAAIRKYADDLREAKRAYPEQWPQLHSESESEEAGSSSDDCNEGESSNEEESESSEEEESEPSGHTDDEDDDDHWVTLQEDGAPGHGFNNQRRAQNGSHGVGTAHHDSIVTEAASKRP
jgi:hypothetical protein